MNQPSTVDARHHLVVDVALVPAFIDANARERAGTTYVVIDVIRATTTLCLLFDRGCERVLLAPGIAEARAARTRLGAAYLLAGEVGGLPPTGFDIGNSPVEVARKELRGRQVIFATTNGTRAMRACLGGRKVLAGALRNATAVSAAALRSALATIPTSPYPDSSTSADPGTYSLPTVSARATEAHIGERTADVVFVCSGREDKPAYDDTVCAGYLTQTLRALAERDGVAVTLSEGARIALSALDGAEAEGGLRANMERCDAARSIAQIGLSDDLECCMAIDATPIVPAVVGADDEHDLVIVTPQPTHVSV